MPMPFFCRSSGPFTSRPHQPSSLSKKLAAGTESEVQNRGAAGDGWGTRIDTSTTAEAAEANLLLMTVAPQVFDRKQKKGKGTFAIVPSRSETVAGPAGDLGILRGAMAETRRKYGMRGAACRR
jgi:hypothetical protein